MVLVALISLLACSGKDSESTGPGSGGDTGEALDPLAWLNEPGPYRAGYRTVEVRYTEPLSGEVRALRTAVWYPTLDTTGSSPTYFGGLDPDALEAATPATGPFPLLVYSHGHQGYAEASSFLMTHLASHGWVVAAPDHTGNTTLDGGERETAIYYERPLDISAVIDHFAALPDGEPWSDTPTDSVGVIGHSFGGYTSFALGGAQYDLDTLAPACADGTYTGHFCVGMTSEAEALLRAGLTDPRVSGLLAMAPGDFDLFAEAGVGAVSVPTMLMTGTLDPSTEGGGARYEAALQVEPRWSLSIEGGGHMTFTDFSEILEPIEGIIPKEDGWQIVRVYGAAFAYGLLGDERVASILDGSLSVGPAALLTPTP
jgi:predicted dienelactone hydrolase